MVIGNKQAGAFPHGKALFIWWEVRAVSKGEPSKDDLIWNKELGIYIFPKDK